MLASPFLLFLYFVKSARRESLSQDRMAVASGSTSITIIMDIVSPAGISA